MKKISILFTMLFCLLYCVTVFANNQTTTNNENVMTMEKFIGITDVSDISMIHIRVHKYGDCHIVDEYEIKQGYNILMTMPLQEIVDGPTYFEIDKNDGAYPGDVERYHVTFYKNGEELTSFSVTADKIFTHDWVFVSGNMEDDKENEFYKFLQNAEKKHQRYTFGLNEQDIYNNEVFVDTKKVTYKWGKPYINKNNQMMVPFKELNTALNTQATYDVKAQMVSVRKGKPVPLYGEVIDEITYVAVRDLAILGGYDTYWDDELKIVYITKEDGIKVWNKETIYLPEDEYYKRKRMFEQ